MKMSAVNLLSQKCNIESNTTRCKISKTLKNKHVIYWFQKTKQENDTHASWNEIFKSYKWRHNLMVKNRHAVNGSLHIDV